MFLSKPMLGTQLDRSDSLNNPVLDLLLNEGHGDRVNDLSGWGNHGTMHGFDFPPSRTSGWNPGGDGVALNFDSTDDYVDCGNDESLNPGTSGFAISHRVKFNSTTDIAYLSKEGGSNFSRWWVGLANSHIQIDFRDDTGDELMLTSVTAVTGIWYHIISVLDRSTDKAYLYLNGVLDSTADASAIGNVIPSHAFCIGKDSWDRFLNGTIAGVRILPRAMSEFEIMQTQIDPYGVYLQ